MADQNDKYSKRKGRSSSASTVVSISLVLIVLGSLGLILLNAQKLSTYFKESLVINVFLRENVKEVDIMKMKKSLDAEIYVKSTVYITKERAAELVEEDLGEEFVSFLGYNPLLASIDLYLHADYANPDSVAWIEKELVGDHKVKEVVYRADLLQAMSENVGWITFWMLIFGGVLMTIAVALINNTIRLSIYSKRFLIKSMQLVGATASFIQRPFVFRGIMQGVLSAIIAIGVLLALLSWIQSAVPDYFNLNDLKTIGMLFAFVLLIGVVISWLSTTLAVRKYIRLKSDDLY